MANAEQACEKPRGGSWARRDRSELPTSTGDVLAASESEGKRDQGKNRLYRILISESAYERGGYGTTKTRPNPKTVRNGWTRAVNKRLTLDRLLTNAARFKKDGFEGKLAG